MFSYYGSKSKIVDLYPKPLYDNIIEPFAGSARYSLRWFDRDVLLVDKYAVVVRVWQYLQRCSEKDIMNLPTLKQWDDIREFSISEDEKLFLGMIAGVASTSPRNKVSQYAAHCNGNQNRLNRIAKQLYKIRHWKIIQADYTVIPNQLATWFIDPPYQVGGNAYAVSNKSLDYGHLSEWCQHRDGQAIVCENTKANWLEFRPLICKKGANNKYTTEAIWSNLQTSFDWQQQQLF